MEIGPGHVRFALAEDVWTLGNRVLYDLCREHPDHTKPDVVIAKVWLIGRTYAAAIERRKVVNNDPAARVLNDAFYENTVAPAMIESEIDTRLAKLQRYAEVGEDSIAEVIACHKYLTALFNRIAGQDKRSLASKYLHFHMPSHFFLYDSRAAFGLRMVPFKHGVRRDVGPLQDPEYAGFALKLLGIQERIEREFGVKLSPRQIDRFLLRLADYGVVGE